MWKPFNVPHALVCVQWDRRHAGGPKGWFFARFPGSFLSLAPRVAISRLMALHSQCWQTYRQVELRSPVAPHLVPGSIAALDLGCRGFRGGRHRFDHLIDQPIGDCFFGIHETIAIGIAFDLR